jgi:uncharacterized membrane protein
MSGTALGLVLAVFLACAVEAVEACTIVLAVGSTRSWRSAFLGVGAATVVLAALIGALGPALVLLPLSALRLVVGALLLIFGLQWLRKAILRYGGLKALHDEREEFERARAEAARAGAKAREGVDSYSFVIAFKGVLLEGLEVAFIVITFGANQHRVGLAAAAAAVAVAAVLIAGFTVRGPLQRVPENALKYAVGVMLCAFGSFWSAEGAGAHWPGSELALLFLIGGYALCGILMARLLRVIGARDARATEVLEVARS